jgi:hypothetical protein
MNPICYICGCPTEKWKQTRKKGNICNICARNDQKIKRLAKKLNKRYNRGILISGRSNKRNLIDNNKEKKNEKRS